ncbi:MAG: hypothetical protein M3O36_13610 [Myxococcota bacterium]|nr:hypothetical protein [Myxococcota bacterium]
MTISDRRQTRIAFVCAAIACHVLARGSTASADPPNEAAARSLFSEGRQLVKASRYEEACGKFEAARKLYLSSGLLLNLADCHERLHRTASAWAEFGEASEAAASAGRAGDQAEAKRRRAALEEHLARLTVHVENPAPNETVLRDGVAVEPSAWDSPIPVDPGAHTLTAEAHGRESWSASVEVDEPGRTVVARVPSLGPLSGSEARGAAGPGRSATDQDSFGESPRNGPAHTAGADDASKRGSGQRVAGWVVGGVGLAGVATSGVLTIMAESEFGSAQREAGSARIRDSAHAGQLADLATVFLVGGAATALAGVVLWYSAPRAPVSVGATLGSAGARGASLFLSSRFE